MKGRERNGQRETASASTPDRALRRLSDQSSLSAGVLALLGNVSRTTSLIRSAVLLHRAGSTTASQRASDVPLTFEPNAMFLKHMKVLSCVRLELRHIDLVLILDRRTPGITY